MDFNPSIPTADGRVLSTLERDGSRRWLYPRLAKGRFWARRRAVAYALIAVYSLIPFVRVGGKPALLLDLVHRRFTVFGATFLPTDTALLAVGLLTALGSVFLVTALLGRVWCGWACPQTVYMEFVFRPIERLFGGRTGRGGAPARAVAGWRKPAMYATYGLVALHIANTLLAYFVPAEVLLGWITSSPAAHPAGFAIVAAVTVLIVQLRLVPGAGVRDRLPVRPAAIGPARPELADHRVRREARRAAHARQAHRASRAARGRRPGRTRGRRLHRLLDVRAGLPDRDRHPRRPAGPVRRVRRVHRRVRRGDGQGRPPDARRPTSPRPADPETAP